MGQRCCNGVNATEADLPAKTSDAGAVVGGCPSGKAAAALPAGRVRVAKVFQRTASSPSLVSSPSSEFMDDDVKQRSNSAATRSILVQGDRGKTLDALLMELESSVKLLQVQYQNVLRHPHATADTLQHVNALMRRFDQQVRRMRLRVANSWQPDGEGNAEEWMTLLLGGRKRFSSLHDVVRQVQLEGRIIRRWKQRNPALDLRHSRSIGELPRVDVNCWDAVDVFKLESDGQQPLSQVFMSIWGCRNFGALSKASTDQAVELIRAVEAAYRPNPYHNRMHAADVTSTAYYIWSQLAAQDHMRGYFSELDLLAVTLAAAVHDMAHPGTGNDFLVKTQHPLALRYSDRSVLEHFHAASAFALIKEMNVPLLEHNLPSPPTDTLKGRVVDMVLATDMAQHRRVVEDMAAEVAVSKQPQDINKLILEPALLHLADIGHPLRARLLHKEWSVLVREEFFAQGDQEKKLGLQPTPLCDREKAPKLAKSQQGFLSFVVLPCWRPMCQILGPEAAKPLEGHLADNQRMWEELSSEDTEKEAPAEGSTSCGRGPPSPCRAKSKARKGITSVF